MYKVGCMDCVTIKGKGANAVGNKYRLVVLPGLDRRIGDGVREGVAGSFDVSGGNDSRIKVMCCCYGRNLCCKHFLPTQEHSQVHIG